MKVSELKVNQTILFEWRDEDGDLVVDQMLVKSIDPQGVTLVPPVSYNSDFEIVVTEEEKWFNIT